MEKHFKKFSYKLKKNVLWTGIYFDNPNALKDSSKFRYALGFRILSDSAKADLEKILVGEEFKWVKLPKAKTYATSIIIRNFLSYFFISIHWNRLSKKTMEFLKNKKDLPGAGVEFYYTDLTPISCDIHFVLEN